MINVYQCLHFVHLLDVIPHRPFSEEVRNLLGSLGTIFLRLRKLSASLLSILFNQLRFTVLLYHKECTLSSVNEARKELFCKKNKTLEDIPLPRMRYLKLTIISID